MRVAGCRNQEEQEGGGEDGVELDEHQVWGQEPQVLPLVYCSHPKLCCDHWLLPSLVALAPVCCCCTAAATAAGAETAGAAAVVAAVVAAAAAAAAAIPVAGSGFFWNCEGHGGPISKI